MSGIFYSQNGPSIVFDESSIKGDIGRWISKLNDNIDKMASKIDEYTIEQTAKDFMVTRNFPRRNIHNRALDFTRVAPLLKIAIDGLTVDNLVDRVEKFAGAMSAEPGLTERRNGRPYIQLVLLQNLCGLLDQILELSTTRGRASVL